MSDNEASVHSRVGIEHVGITVPSIAEATAYFEAAFGAEVMFDLIPVDSEPARRKQALEALGSVDLAAMLGVPAGTRLNGMRHLALQDGPVIELFEYIVDGQRSPVVPSDLGVQHIAVYVEDIHAAAERVAAAGGTLLGGPLHMFGFESGEGNFAWYTKAPWGSTIELITYPSRMPGEDVSPHVRPGRAVPKP